MTDCFGIKSMYQLCTKQNRYSERIDHSVEIPIQVLQKKFYGSIPCVSYIVLRFPVSLSNTFFAVLINHKVEHSILKLVQFKYTFDILCI